MSGLSNLARRVSFLRFFGLGVPLAMIEAATDVVPPFLYGFRDLEALFFALIAWHPIVGSLKRSERLVLLLGAIIPAIPPTLVLGGYMLAIGIQQKYNKYKENRGSVHSSRHI